MSNVQRSYTNGSGAHCAIKGCSNSRKKLQEALGRECFEHRPLTRKKCTCEPPFQLHKLPTDPDLKRQWLAALNRKFPPKYLFVCSFHFVDKKTTETNPVPELYLGYEKIVKKRRKLVKVKHDLDSNLSRPLLTCRSTISTSTADCDSGPGHVTNVSVTETHTITSVDTTIDQNENAGTVVLPGNKSLVDSPERPTELHIAGGSYFPKKVCHDMAIQYEDPSLETHEYCKKRPVKHLLGEPLSVNVVNVVECANCMTVDDQTVTQRTIKTDSDSKLYVGVSKEMFLAIVESITPVAKKTWAMLVEDQILMTLMKLKLNLLLSDLARRFNVSVSLCSNTISFWINELANHLTPLVAWLPRETIRGTMPACFKKRYPKTTCVIDCAETIMQKPSNLKSRGECYSNYKSHNTVKYLVAIAPSGLIMFISDAYGGRCSDKFIVQNCGILNRLLPGDEVMADRGFTIRDLLFPLRVKLNIPAFSHGKQLSDEEVTRTRRLANVRIHVERAIRRLKVFKIIKDTVPVSFTKKFDKILRICAALVNLGPDLISAK